MSDPSDDELLAWVRSLKLDPDDYAPVELPTTTPITRWDRLVAAWQRRSRR